MAKQISTLQISGRIGEIVGQQGKNGVNFARRFSSPTNPNTELQRKVRTKFTLMGQLSSVIPAELIAGMRGNNKTKRRARFNKKVISCIEFNTTASANNTIAAWIGANQILLSEGRYPEFAYNEDYSPVAAASQDGKNVIFGLKEGFTWADLMEDYKIADIIGVAILSRGEEVVGASSISFRSVNHGNPGNTVTINGRRNTSFAAYLIPVYEKTAGARLDYEERIKTGDYSENYTLMLNMVQSGSLEYGESKYLGSSQMVN